MTYLDPDNKSSCQSLYFICCRIGLLQHRSSPLNGQISGMRCCAFSRRGDVYERIVGSFQRTHLVAEILSGVSLLIQQVLHL